MVSQCDNVCLVLHGVYISGADKKAELKKLNRSISICFLELLDILIDNPASPLVSTYISFILI